MVIRVGSSVKSMQNRRSSIQKDAKGQKGRLLCVSCTDEPTLITKPHFPATPSRRFKVSSPKNVLWLSLISLKYLVIQVWEIWIYKIDFLGQTWVLSKMVASSTISDRNETLWKWKRKYVQFSESILHGCILGEVYRHGLKTGRREQFWNRSQKPVTTGDLNRFL